MELDEPYETVPKSLHVSSCLAIKGPPLSPSAVLTSKVSGDSLLSPEGKLSNAVCEEFIPKELLFLDGESKSKANNQPFPESVIDTSVTIRSRIFSPAILLELSELPAPSLPSTRLPNPAK